MRKCGMDYKKIYDALIADRIKNPPLGYVERHHIVPRSMGGTDDPINIVALSGRDHFYAHLLLAKIYGGTQWCAVIAMSMKSIRHDRNYAVAARQYERARIGLVAAMTGRKHTDEAIQKIAAASKGRVPWNKGKKTKGHANYTNRKEHAHGRGRPPGYTHSEEVREKIRKSKIGRKRSEETKRKIGDAVRRSHASPEMREKISKASRDGRNKNRRDTDV